MPDSTPNRKEIAESLLQMLEELNDAEALELEDFIVNHCSNEDFVDEDGNYPNLYRIFVTGHRPNLV
jgi:hypothetical protein